MLIWDRISQILRQKTRMNVSIGQNKTDFETWWQEYLEYMLIWDRITQILRHKTRIYADMRQNITDFETEDKNKNVYSLIMFDKISQILRHNDKNTCLYEAE